MTTLEKTAQAEVETPETERPDIDPRERTKPKRQPPYAVILHNDDLNGMDFVVSVICKVFKYTWLHATWLMLKAHASGRCIVWTGSREVAELKAEQLKSCGADPMMKANGATTLSVSIEALPQ
jgi:ATP-dependent Clp protease adaptor protein ClpS